MKLGGLEITFGKSATKSYPKRQHHADFKYDGAQTSHVNARHWANADGLSADEANNKQVRKITRDRVRYERANNSYFGGIIDTYGESIIGTGPRLQFMDPDDQDLNNAVETAFNDWSAGVQFGSKLLTFFTTAVGDGESFMIMGTTTKNPRSPINLNYDLIDCERCSSGIFSNQPNNIDGVVLNEKKEVISYTFLKEHPGGQRFVSLTPDALITKQADQVLHYFKKQRPEQHRGISELIAALPLGAKLRAYTLSTMNAAKIAATFSGVLHTTSGAFDDDDSDNPGEPEFEAFDTFAVDEGQLLVLPDQYEMRQMKAEHPTGSYKEFKREIVAENGRSVGMPLNMSLGDSSGYNLASGRLDRLAFKKITTIRQADVSNRTLHPVMTRFLEEIVLHEGLLSDEHRRKLTSPGYKSRWTWFWDGDSAIDPAKEATAREKNLKSLSTTHREEYASKGQDYRVAYKQIATEKQEREALGITEQDLNPEPVEPVAKATASTSDLAEEIVEHLIDEGIING